MYPRIDTEKELGDLESTSRIIIDEFETIVPQGSEFERLLEALDSIRIEEESVYYTPTKCGFDSDSDSTEYQSCEEEVDPWEPDFKPTGHLVAISTPPASRKRIVRKKQEFTKLQSEAKRLLKEFSGSVFYGKLDDIEIKWSRRLRTTAGRAVHTKDSVYIELSLKIIDTVDKIRHTLAHEMCHVACFVMDNQFDQPHGKHFQKWARRVEKVYKDIKVTICHDYEIQYTHYYHCTNAKCGQVFGRHSKSVDLNKTGCGRCQSPLQLKDV